MGFLSELVLILFSIVASGYYSGMETGIVSINRLRLKHMLKNEVPGAAILQEFRDRPDHLFGTALIGTNLFATIATVVAVSLGERVAGTNGNIAASALIAIVILIFAEYLPKAWFQGRPAHRSLTFARLLQWNGYIFYPFSIFITSITKILVPVRSAPAAANRPFITIDEFRHLTSEGAETGTISSDEQMMIHKVLNLTELSCLHVMIPRDKMIRVYTDTTAEDLLSTSRNQGLTRLPVFDQEQRRFVGIVYIFDILAAEDSSGLTAADFMRPPQFIRDDTPADEILPRMRVNRQPMTLVEDRSGKTVGLITMEDVLRQIVGEI